MGKNSAIGWTHHTFNPWWGCTLPLVQIGGKQAVSPECVNCYARTWAKRCGFDIWGDDKDRRFFGDRHWNEPLGWNREAAAAGERHRVFCLSMGDVLEDRRDLDPYRARLWDLIAASQSLDWLLLTKRAELLETLVPDWVWTLRNVWPGVTAGSQDSADLRMPFLLRLKVKHPHLIAWASVEPMLERMELEEYLWPLCRATRDVHDAVHDGGLWCEEASLDWVVIGGESGPRARPFDVEAGRKLLGQCQAAGVPIFWKQFGASPFERDRELRFSDAAGADAGEWPEWARVQQFPENRRAA